MIPKKGDRDHMSPGKMKQRTQGDDSLSVEQAFRMDPPPNIKESCALSFKPFTHPFWNCDHLCTLRTRLDRSAYRIQEVYCPQSGSTSFLCSSNRVPNKQSFSTDWSLMAACDNYFIPVLRQRKVPE